MPAYLRWGSAAALVLVTSACSRSLLLPIEDDGGGGTGPTTTSATTTSTGGSAPLPPDTCDAGTWTRTLGGPGDEELLDVAIGPQCRVTLFGRHDETFVVDGRTVDHESGNDAFVVQLNGAGEVRWARTLNTTGNVEEVAGVATPDGGVVLLSNIEGQGRIAGLALDATGGSDVAAVAFDSLGNLRWYIVLGDALSQFGTAITGDDEGNVYIAGRFRGAIDGPNFSLFSAGNNTTGFVIKLNPNGEPLWGFQLPPDASVFPNALDWNDGRLYFGGALSGNPVATPVLDMPTEDIDAFICLISPDDGSYLVGQSFPAPGFDVFNHITATPNEVYAGGAFELAFFSPDPLFAVDGLDGLGVITTASLEPVASFAFEGPGDQTVNDFGLTTNFEGYVGGRFDQSMSFAGSPPIFSANDTDGFFLVPGEQTASALGASVEGEVMAVRASLELPGTIVAGTYRGLLAPPPPNEQSASSGGRDAFVLMRPAVNF